MRHNLTLNRTLLTKLNGPHKGKTKFHDNLPVELHVTASVITITAGELLGRGVGYV